MNNDEPLTLKDVAQAASDKHNGARGRELGRIAQGRGLKLTYTTVDHMLEGRYKSRPGRGTLDALAELSGIDRGSVYAAAGVPLPLRPMAEDLPPDADLLTGPQRRVVIDTVRLFAQQNRLLHESEARAKAGNDSGTSAKKSLSQPGEPIGYEGGTPIYEAEPSGLDEGIGVMPLSKGEGASES